MFVNTITWFLILKGLFSLLITAPLLILGGVDKSGAVSKLGGVNLIKGVSSIAVSFGIHNMRRWALYAFTALTAITIIESLHSFATGQVNGDIANFKVAIFQVLALVYLWIISKKFT